MITIHAAMTEGVAEVKGKTLKEMAQYMDGEHLEFSRGVVLVHRKSVFEILILLLRYTPVVTGRLRGSWTPYLDHHNRQGSYMKYMTESALGKAKGTIGKVKAAVTKALGRDAVSRGKKLGTWRENNTGLVTTIGTNVVYAESANRSSKYFTKAVRQGQRILMANYEAYMEAARKVGWIPRADDISDKPGKPGRL